MRYVEVLHEALYARIPSFECRKGCTDCCGPVPFSRWEAERIQDRRVATSITCPYAVGGRCEIYEERPLLCRLFGAVDDVRLKCPHGCGPEKKLSVAEAEGIMREYFRIFEL
jgi:hypothetical protein